MPEFKARYEFKYLLRPEQVGYVRELARTFCSADAYGDNGVYDVNSLYFDTWDWMTARQTVEGQRNRFKARIRTYGFQDHDPVFCEIKSRVGTTILKRRAKVAREHVEDICRNDVPPADGFPALIASHQGDVDRYMNRMDVLDLRPRLWVRYQREAYGSDYGDGARLTFDSALEVQAPDLEHPYQPDMRAWVSVPLDGPDTILEMKFNGAYPFWMRRVVHDLGLRRVSCSKYVQGAEYAGEVPWNVVEKGAAWMAF